MFTINAYLKTSVRRLIQRPTSSLLMLHREVGMARSMHKKIHLILDFDGTIVENNTIPLMDTLRQDDQAPCYRSFLDPYLKDYEDHVRDYHPDKAQRTTLEQEYQYLDSLESVERRSIERIEASGWLKGLQWNKNDVSVFTNAGTELQAQEILTWRKGFVDLVQQVWKHEGIVEILSVNWSGNFIRCLLRQEYGNAINVERIHVHSNEIDPSGSGQISRVQYLRGDNPRLCWPAMSSPGSDLRGIWTINDKSRFMRYLTADSKLQGVTVVYVGDSKTDLRCIVESDVGICMRVEDDMSEEQASLKEVLDRLHIIQQSVDGKTLLDKSSNESLTRSVWCAHNFYVIKKALYDGPN